jgi:hypothetical protein
MVAVAALLLILVTIATADNPVNAFSRIKMYSKNNITTGYAYLQSCYGSGEYDGAGNLKMDNHIKCVDDFNISSLYAYPNIADSLHLFKYEGNDLFYFVIDRKISLDNVDSVTIDSMMWSDLGRKDHWIDSVEAELLRTRPIVFAEKTCGYSSDGYSDFIFYVVSIDSAWTKERFHKLMHRNPSDTTYNDTLFYSTMENNPQIKKALMENELFIFTEGYF